MDRDFAGKVVSIIGSRASDGIRRDGTEILRNVRPNSLFVQSLLAHVRKRGFTAAPAPLGIDEQNCQEMLSFIEGSVPMDLGWFPDDALAEAARLIRHYHDATVELAAPWGLEVVCHNDLSPCNFVFRHNLPFAIIDFDAAAPGKRAWDVGYAAWMWLDMGNAYISAAEQTRRLELFIGAYGGLNRLEVYDALIMRQRILSARGRRIGNRGLTAWAEKCMAWTKRALG